MSAHAGAPPTERAATSADVLTLLADVLELAATAFSQPGADQRSRASELVRDRSFAFPGGPELAASLRALAGAETADLDVEYVRLFLHGRSATAHPYESFYRTGLLMDPECLAELGALFAAAGVAPAEGETSPDHLSVEASFLALLLRGLSTATGDAAPALAAIASGLLEHHLHPFAAAFRGRLAGLGPAPYFASAADALTHALQGTTQLLRTATSQP
jgi:TorA maturation chaperone TorD